MNPANQGAGFQYGLYLSTAIQKKKPRMVIKAITIRTPNEIEAILGLFAITTSVDSDEITARDLTSPPCSNPVRQAQSLLFCLLFILPFFRVSQKLSQTGPHLIPSPI